MNKNLHDIDELFRSGMGSYEATPSAGLKERLDLELDKKQAASYKKRWIGWKRTSILLLLLLAGLIIYEVAILKTSQVDPGKRKEKEETHRNNIVPGNANDNASNVENGSYNEKPIEAKIDNASAVAIGDVREYEFSPQKEITEIKSGQGTNDDDLLKSMDLFPTGKMNVLQLKNESSEIKITQRNTNGDDPLLPINDSLMKTIAVDKMKGKREQFFQPFWMMTGFVSYDQAGYHLDSDEPSAITSMKYREAHEPSFSLGILLTRQLSNRWGLQSGLTYSNTAIGMKPQKAYAFKDPTGDVAYKYITSSGYAFIKPGFGPQPVVGDSLTTAEAKHIIENITIPLSVKYTVSNKKVSITPGIGIEANLITKANLEVDIEDSVNSEIVFVRKLSGTKTFYCSIVADAELRYHINNKLSLTVRPVYRHAISPITKNTEVETFPYSFGIGTGITLKF